MTLGELLEAALKLDRPDRELLIEELTASLLRGFAGADIEKAWLDEIDRRRREVADGTAEVVE
jgi:Putative addiction module component